jgi:hypothetical protein
LFLGDKLGFSKSSMVPVLSRWDNSCQQSNYKFNSHCKYKNWTYSCSSGRSCLI